MTPKVMDFFAVCGCYLVASLCLVIIGTAATEKLIIGSLGLALIAFFLSMLMEHYTRITENIVFAIFSFALASSGLFFWAIVSELLK